MYQRHIICTLLLISKLFCTKARMGGGKGGRESLSNWLGPNGTPFAPCHFRAQKSLHFQGLTLTMALVMDIACLKIITSHAIKTTGTLIVIMLEAAQQ
jgi:hypothetical protein